MTNLSELSKPVAYDYQIAGACIADGHNENGKWVDWNNKLSRYCPPDWMVEEGKVTELKPLYSQEYVSALLAELDAKDKRICELEAIATEYAGKFQKAQDANKHLVIMSNDDKKRIAELERANTSQDDHINQQQDRIESLEKTNTGLGQRLGTAEKRLATPVRLVAYRNSPDMHTKQYYEAIGFNQGIDACYVAVRAAGFTVEGDE